MNDLEHIKSQIKPILKKYGIKKAGIFGSSARGESVVNDLDHFILTVIGTPIGDVARFLFGEASTLYCETTRVHPEINVAVVTGLTDEAAADLEGGAVHSLDQPLIDRELRFQRTDRQQRGLREVRSDGRLYALRPHWLSRTHHLL
jgi:hypothetical protein